LEEPGILGDSDWFDAARKQRLRNWRRGQHAPDFVQGHWPAQAIFNEIHMQNHFLEPVCGPEDIVSFNDKPSHTLFTYAWF
jgi:hypothetical protein